MTTFSSPEAEAAYALDYGSDRSTLSPAAQVAYDRLTEERRAGATEARTQTIP
jgi:hypothetical protein